MRLISFPGIEELITFRVNAAFDGRYNLYNIACNIYKSQKATGM